MPGGQERGELGRGEGVCDGRYMLPLCRQGGREQRGVVGGNCWESGGLKNPRHTVEQEDNLSI